MTNFQNTLWRAAIVGRWTARIFGTLASLFFLALVFGEGPPNPFHLSLAENLSFICLTALFLGLAFAWYREGWGGAITLAGFAGMALLGGQNLQMPALQIPAAIGALHVICWLRLRLPPPDPRPELSLSRFWIAGLATALGLFLVLSANEILGDPPLMPPALRPGPNLVGTWSTPTPDFALTIQPNGVVSGNISGAIRYNRTWFGKLMHWRTDYIIRGTQARQPLTVNASELRIGRKTLRKVD
jgi:hypothetical protein